ncbi:ubiquitin carboxyl-terminal hydrolase 18-like [Juglans microcarpa x Juglans regia]|uniref:ubiquitin carboxyl-terminal hydrolase 18-like n=1 Tax=Juglans microcarpa x Juglans regia TaxID=2249226 RepID=UPI001B7D9501|nr:ubiquitin carboxyl-terminal hydrolase 18-like [Juglans microcarpa x Juglans regia]
MLVSAVPLDLNWFVQFIFTVFVIAVGLLHLVKNTASKYFEVGANFEAAGDRSDPAPMPGVLMDDSFVCANCGNPATKKCSRCKAVRYCSQKCQEVHWKFGHKTNCKFQPSGVNSTSSLAGRKSSAIALVPAHGTSKFIKQPEKILFPYDEFLRFFNWEKPGFPPCGLLNCGNSCFANVVLQCLTFTRPLAAYLLEKGHQRECHHNGWCFLCEFQTHVKRATQSLQAFSPINILSRLPNIGGNLGYGSQEDAHEFMRFAIDTMQSICLDEFGGEKAVEPSSQETTLIQHIFGGQLQSQVICTKCNNVSNQYENMMDLTVEIHGDAASLEECLDQFTVKEWLHGENMYKCDGCNDYVKAWKRLTVKKAPNILTIALKRFQSGRFGKLNKRVAFPETLDLSPYMSEAGDGTDTYKLYAVVVHVDMLNASFFGHYICYTKDFRGKWYRIDDCKVTGVELEEVLSQGAYMLLYSRVYARPSCLISVEPSEKEQQQMMQEKVVGCLTTAESKPINGFAVPSDCGPCSMVSRCEEESSTGINSLALKEHLEDMDMVNCESSVCREVLICETESSMGISIEDLREDTDGMGMVNSASNPPENKLLRSERDSSVAFDSQAGRDSKDMNLVTHSKLCPADLKEVSCSEMEYSVSIDCKREDSQDVGGESIPSSVGKDIEVYANGHADQNGILCPPEHTHDLVSAEVHKLKHESPLWNSDSEHESGAKRVEIMGSSL